MTDQQTPPLAESRAGLLKELKDYKDAAEVEAFLGDEARQEVADLTADRDRLAGRVRELEAENAALREQIEGHCERIAKQSELLSRRAEAERSNHSFFRELEAKNARVFRSDDPPAPI